MAQRSVEVQFSTKVSQQILQRTVRELVLIGNRMGGTNSGDQAVRMISTRFKEYGLSVEILESPERLTYTHHQWKLKVESPKRLRGLIQNEWLAGFSPSVSETVCELKYIRPGALTLDSVRNRAVLINVPLTHELYEELSNAGIRCILHYSVVNSEAYMHGAMITQLTPSQSNKVPVYNISRFAGERLRQELEYGTPITLRYSSKTVIRYGNSKTVIATLKGKSSQYYIVCAHGDSDSGGPGADDNASGVAGILEVARILSAMVRMKLIQPPVYTLRFIIWGTEYVSASDFVKKRDYELDQIRGVINVDQIGIGRPRYCVYFEGNDVPFNEHLLRVFNSIGEEYAGKQGFWKEATTIPFQGGTDSHVFLPQYLRQLRVRQREIPVITVFTAAWNEPKAVAQTKGWGSKAWKGAADTVIIGYSPYYHSSLDIPRLTTDREPHIVWGVKAVGIGLLRLAWDNTEISK
ncbi:MAG: M28 family metallopeptidase [Bacteroidetes bacterium]|nr:M28 family metallopeptidase [Bacteroidota bacterium]